MTKRDAARAFRRALRWLEANPDKHLCVDLAGTAANRYHEAEKITTTMSPEATCFCALGRFAYEIGLDTDSIYEAADPLIKTGLIAHSGGVWRVNDKYVSDGDKRGAINALRQVVPAI